MTSSQSLGGSHPAVRNTRPQLPPATRARPNPRHPRPRRPPEREAPHKLVVDAGLGYANEQRVLGNNLSTATVGAGGLYTVKIAATSELTEDGHAIFLLSEGSDWRYTNTIALTAKVSTMFSLKASNAIRYLHAPTIGFKNTDAVTSIALVAKF